MDSYREPVCFDPKHKGCHIVDDTELLHHPSEFGCTCNMIKSETKEDDNVNHPSHYTAYKGLEVIDLTEQMNFNRGNAVKYICRAGLKDKSKEIEDLRKALWYIGREISRLNNGG